MKHEHGILKKLEEAAKAAAGKEHERKAS